MCQHCRRFTKYLTIKGLHLRNQNVYKITTFHTIGGLHNISKIMCLYLRNHGRFTLYLRNQEVYIISQKPGSLHHISEARSFTLYFRNQEVYIISQKPGGLHNISQKPGGLHNISQKPGGLHNISETRRFT